VEVIPLGLDLDRFAGARRDPLPVRRALGLSPEARLLAIVGRLVPIKDHPTLFAALARLDPGVHLLVVGDGESRAGLEARVRDLGLSDRVHFLGWRQDLDVILAGTDVVISCSINEGTPVALIEAMAAGAPVVGTDVGGVGDLVEPGRTGWLVAPRDAEALAAAVREALAEPALAARRAEAARRLVLERHTAEGLVRHMEAFYERLMEERRCVCW
jgi:glycosyltransferase involved in cell wall biosynthesis